ncbi:hypothetical protein CAY60_020740 [Shouchella clausii]|uniref:hypothetical protein n=1 Tax=Bacteria TaxID=2 RepID=UPI0004E6E450|nr:MULTISPECIES: hypothetical protein [Bacteria]ALA55240.1 hypothetical protein DB29_0P0028 [Shouchella clausii]MBU3266270.1 hypothetical protein [Shouchella clausii]MBU3509363.1 hypothetical protein [Shouchella clausii]MDP0462084.1 hypothetical protein [Shouchella rhizosphaerae]MDP5267729.1 hypothetical protein [Shouchella clausii]
MARRKKEYKQGDRINIYLSRDLTPEFIEWINKQSDLSNFFLYAVQQLYSKTGYVDVAEVMPRKINFDLSATDLPVLEESNKVLKETETKEGQSEPVKEDKQTKAWSDIEDLEDPFA